MQAQNDPQFRADFWDRVFPGQVPAGELEVTVVDERGFELDGVALVPVEVGHTDTDATTMLHVPEMGLLVAGDVVYNGVHLYLTESGGVTGIDEWLAALDTAEALNPATVIAGHKDSRAFDNPSQIQATRRYLTDARRLLESSESAEEFYEAMLRLHPNRTQPRRVVGRGHHTVSGGITVMVSGRPRSYRLLNRFARLMGCSPTRSLGATPRSEGSRPSALPG